MRRQVRVAVAAAMASAIASSVIADDPAPPTSTSSSSFRCPTTEAIMDKPPDDPNADPFPRALWYVNQDRTMWAGWDAVRMVSGDKGNKVLWIRPQGLPLEVSGRRLDGDAPPLRARVPCCYPTGFQTTGLFIPTEGCWEITGKAGTNALTFITRVTPARPMGKKTRDKDPREP